MSMLAEPRSRQKWSDDPRNTRWANDKTKFGYQMLTKMGWSDGKGLGQNESGQTSHIKVKKRKSNAGIGSKRSHDDDWIAHQNDFNDLLNSLNQGIKNKEDSNGNINSLEDRVKSSKKKILYTKFVKSKDLSNASAHDLACIFGQRSKSAPATPQMSDDDGNTSDISTASCPVTEKNNNASTEHGFTTVHTGVSIADYFAKKMASLKRENRSVEGNQIDEDLSLTDLHQTRKKKKVEVMDPPIVDVASESDSSVHELVDIKKTNCIRSERESYNESSKKKKKKKKDKNEIVSLKCGDESCVVIEDKSDVIVPKKKKKKKVIDVIELDSDCAAENDISSEYSDSASYQKTVTIKKKKRKKNDTVENNMESSKIDASIKVVTITDDAIDNIADIRKKRKKRSKPLSDSCSDVESSAKRICSINSDGEDCEGRNSKHNETEYETELTSKKKKKKKKKEKDSIE